MKGSVVRLRTARMRFNEERAAEYENVCAEVVPNDFDELRRLRLRRS